MHGRPRTAAKGPQRVGGKRELTRRPMARSDSATELGGDAAQVYCPPLREVRLSLHASDRKDARAAVSPVCQIPRRLGPVFETDHVGEPPAPVRGAALDPSFSTVRTS